MMTYIANAPCYCAFYEIVRMKRQGERDREREREMVGRMGLVVTRSSSYNMYMRKRKKTI